MKFNFLTLLQYDTLIRYLEWLLGHLLDYDYYIKIRVVFSLWLLVPDLKTIYGTFYRFFLLPSTCPVCVKFSEPFLHIIYTKKKSIVSSWFLVLLSISFLPRGLQNLYIKNTKSYIYRSIYRKNINTTKIQHIL